MALLQHLLVTPLCLAQVSWQQSTAARPKNTYSGSLRDTFAQGLLKTDVPWVPTRWVEYPHGPSIMLMVSHPCALTLSLATLGSYPCSTIVRMTPPLDSCTHSLSENEFSHGTHLPCMSHLQHPRVARLGSVPVYGNKALPYAKKTIISPPVHFRQGIP